MVRLPFGTAAFGTLTGPPSAAALASALGSPALGTAGLVAGALGSPAFTAAGARHGGGTELRLSMQPSTNSCIGQNTALIT